MDIFDSALPEVYKSSADFRFFCKWFKFALSKIQYDTENLFDLYDPLRCPSNLLWMLADSMGFKYDDRLPVAFNRLVLLYFMSMIRNKGSKDGVTLAAETNLAQFTVQASIANNDDDIFNDRLVDTSIPVNAVYVTPHTADGYIDIVYFSEKVPVDACIEYVRPLGMYLFQHAGVRYDARTRISVDARLSQGMADNAASIGMSIGPTKVGHYRREDYARLQRLPGLDDTGQQPGERIVESDLNFSESAKDIRNPVWANNSEYEGVPVLNAGYRALSSLQLCNNEHVITALMPDSAAVIFGIGYGPQDVCDADFDDVPIGGRQEDNEKPWNLLYDRAKDEANSVNVRTVDAGRTDYGSNNAPTPAVNPAMETVADAMVMSQSEDGSTISHSDIRDDGILTITTTTVDEE